MPEGPQIAATCKEVTELSVVAQRSFPPVWWPEGYSSGGLG